MSSLVTTASNETKEKIQRLDNFFPEIFLLDSQRSFTKGVVVISPGMCTRELHLLEPFIGFQLSKLGYRVYAINTLELKKYALDEADPFERVDLNTKAIEIISKLNPSHKIISYGHSLGCIDLLRSQLKQIKGFVFASPGFKGDKSKFSFKAFLQFIKSFFLNKSIELFPRKKTSESNQFRQDDAYYQVNARFIWNLQKYAHGLENTHLWPQNLPVLAWLGSKEASDGVMEMSQPRTWVKKMSTANKLFKLIENPEAGHEPGWKNPQDAELLAKEIDNWFDEYIV